jgi:hypothetical protein
MTAWIWRTVLVALVAGLAVINAAGVYAQLVAAHVGDRGATAAAIKTKDATLAALCQPSRPNAPPWPPRPVRPRPRSRLSRYVAELVGADTDSERAIRWLTALMVLGCDPLAIALTAAASARRRTAV